MMAMKFGKKFARDTRGAAAVEFALWCSMVFSVLSISLDFGLYLTYAGRIASASEQAAIVAYNRREAGAVDTQTLATFVNAAARTPGTSGSTGTPGTAVTASNPVRTTVTCNGSAAACQAKPAARQCACVSGLTPVYSASTACGAPCASGATSGYYVTLNSEYDFDPIIPAHPLLTGKVIRQSVTVRLQ